MSWSENSELFLEEAQELVGKAETALLALERERDNLELVGEVFRALHTIKGSGAMFGFQAVADFTHSVENLFDEVRNLRIPVDQTIIEVGLGALDGVARLLTQAELDQGHRDLLSTIDGVLTAHPKVPEPSPAEAVPRPWRITLQPHPELLTRGVRLEPLFRELSDLGSLHVQAFTEAIPDLQALVASELHIAWTISLLTSRPLATIREVFLFVEDYMDLQIVPLDLADTPNPVPKLGEILVDRGALEPNQVEEIRQQQKAFGELAVSEGLVAPEQVAAALGEQQILRSAVLEREIRQESATIRVRKDKLDNLVDLVGELVILQSILEAKTRQNSREELEHVAENLGRLVAGLRDATMDIRMVPLAESFASLQRLVRDLARQVGKDLLLEASGGDVELDKNIVEAIKDPLVHIVRNCADHGIEAPQVRAQAGKPAVGTITIGARQVGSRVEISVGDDGGGLDLARIKARAVERGLLDPSETREDLIRSMIFEPGFSTAAKTTGVSGRGVGMDVVKRNVERLRGEVTLRSTSGQGMATILSIPLTLVIIEGLLVQLGTSTYVIPLSQVEECVDWTPEVRVSTGLETMMNLRGRLLPVVSVQRVLGVEVTKVAIPRLVIVNSEGNQAALSVDAVLGRAQVVIKPLPPTIRHLKVLSGATILGDGAVALILDVSEILKASQKSTLGSKEP